MSMNYDNWERLMSAVLRREKDRQIALNHSYSSVSSTSSTSYDLTTSLFDHDGHSLVDAKHRNQLPPLPLPLPPGKQEAVWKSASMSFSPDQRTGKNCLMLGPTRLGTSSGEQFEHYWKIKSDHESRFSEVAELRDSSVFFIKGMIKARMLSPETFYAAYLSFRLTETHENLASAYSFIKRFYDDESDSNYSKAQTRLVRLGPGDGTNGQIAVSREDGWMEVEMGIFYVSEGDNRNVDVTLLELSVNEMRGLIVEGIEFRPLKTAITPIVLKKEDGKRRGKGVFSNFRIY